MKLPRYGSEFVPRIVTSSKLDRRSSLATCEELLIYPDEVKVLLPVICPWPMLIIKETRHSKTVSSRAYIFRDFSYPHAQAMGLRSLEHIVSGDLINVIALLLNGNTQADERTALRFNFIRERALEAQKCRDSIKSVTLKLFDSSRKEKSWQITLQDVSYAAEN